MEFHSLINKMGQVHFCLVVFSFFVQILIGQTVGILIRCHEKAESGLGLHYLPMSHKKDARLIWVNNLYKTAHEIMIFK